MSSRKIIEFPKPEARPEIRMKSNGLGVIDGWNSPAARQSRAAATRARLYTLRPPDPPAAALPIAA
ncbi:MAG TPA: hypothetical protein VFA28_05585 [Bryobacteraceae bacterium]|jgi:hypothetical protein|nr:hypothetical protein [Bryobacteraceae bacterium]